MLQAKLHWFKSGRGTRASISAGCYNKENKCLLVISFVILWVMNALQKYSFTFEVA